MPLPPYEPAPLRGVTPIWTFILVLCAGLVVAMRSNDADEEVPAADLRQSLHVIGRNLGENLLEVLEGATWEELEGGGTQLEFQRAGPEGPRARIVVDEERDVILVERPGADDELRRRLGGPVAALLTGEQPNGLDDNGNGLVDEPGLCFVTAPDHLCVTVTLETLGSPAPYMSMSLTSKIPGPTPE